MSIASVLKHPSVKSTLKVLRLIRRVQRAEDPYTVLDELFKDAPEEVQRVAKAVLDVAHVVAQNPKQDPEEVARQIGIALGLPEDQVEEFIDTVLPLAELIANMLVKEGRKEEKGQEAMEESKEIAEEKFITSENIHM
jgi:ABC-type nitrate/sulfonate/bicarbonate transport system substrate-binding protein